MSKVISFVEIIVGIILLFVPGGQPLGVMLIVGGVTGLAASYLGTGTPKIGRSDKNAPVQHISVDPDAYGTLVYGEAKCGGVMIYQNVCSSDGSQTYDILDYVVAHCFTDLTRGVEHMGAIYVNDQLIPESSIDGSGNVVSGDFAGMVQVWRYDGTQTAADPVLRSAYGSDPELPWPSTAIGKGICYTHYRFKSGTDSDAFNRAFSGGPPNNVATVIKGEKPYDPRTSAYAYSENPAVCLRDFMTRADNGAGVPTTYLDATMLAASANICDEVITYPDGTTTGPRFKCDGASGLGDSRKAIIGDILASMAGEVIQSNGLLSVRSGSYTPPSGTITEDFLSGAATSSEPTQDMRYNHVLTNYIGPKSNWQSVQAPAYPALSSAKYAAWLAQDGTRLDKQLGLKMVTNPENAQVIEQIVGNQSRYMRGVSMQCNAKALAFTTGDRVTLNIPECGEVNKIFKITGMRLRPDFGADVQLVADDPSIYGWDNVIAVDVPGLPLPGTKYSAPPIVSGFVCKPQADGIGIAWTAPDVNKVDLTEVQRGTASAGPFTVIYRGFSNSLVDHLPDDDSTYYYRARNYLGGTYSVFTLVQSQAGKIVSTAADVDARFAAIASDNVLSAGEKPQVITSNTTIVNEQSGIDAQATAYGITSEKTAYDNALSALQSYLTTLTTPKAWNDVSGDTTIVGLTFRAKFTDLYDARQTLLNAIYAAAKGLADGAQNTANDAHTIATANSGNIDNSRFANGLTGWLAGTGWTAGVNQAVYTGYAGATGLSNSLVNTILVPTAAGQRVSVQAMLTAAGATGSCKAAIFWYDSTQAFLEGSFGNSVTGTQGATLSRIIDTAPANAAYCAAGVVAYSGTAGSYTASDVAITLFPASVDELPDGSIYGRPLLNRLNGGKPFIDFAEPFNLNKNIDNIGDGTNFRRVGSGYTDTSGRVTRLWDGTTVRPAADVWDGANRARTGLDGTGRLTTRFATPRNIAGAAFDGGADIAIPSTGLSDSTNLARGGDSITRFGGRTLDNVGDSSGRFAAREANADNTRNYAASGDNMLANPGFESNVVGSVNGAILAVGAPCSDGWFVQNGNIQTYWYSGAARSGGMGVLLRVGNGTVMPSGQGYAWFAQIVSSKIQCSPGDIITYGGYTAIANGDTGGVPSVLSRIGLFAYDVNGAATNPSYSDDSVAGGWRPRGPYVYVVPNGVSQIALEIAFFVNNATGSTITTQGDDIYGFFDDMYVTRNDLRVPGSGQTIGDQRNLLPVTWAGVRSVLSTSPISFSISGTTVSFSVAAVTVNAGGVNVSYSASSGSVSQSAGTTVTYYLYYRDPTSSGGSKSLYITTSVQALAAYPDIVLLGSASVTVSSGGGGSGGTGGGGGGLCVTDAMWIRPGRRAGDAQIGDEFDCIDLPTAAGKHIRALQGISRGVEECVRIITDNGCALECSLSTPFDLPDGRQTTAPRMLGEQVITDLGTATVISTALIGPRPVTRAYLGGVSYAAGGDPTRRIYSHNPGAVKP